ncbi:MAG: hypothetical protein Sapg2KO_33990 [Saprospiraceae bacterium]
MKTFITISFLFFAFTASFSQQYASTSNSKTKAKSPRVNKETRAIMAKVHTKTAVTQIANYLAEELSYPSDMEEQLINGTVVLEIRLNQTGKIKRTKVIESRSRQFENAVQAAMAKMNRVKIDGPFYYGILKFQVPIQFSIDK